MSNDQNRPAGIRDGSFPATTNDAAAALKRLVGEAMTLRRNILGGNERTSAEPNDFDELLALIPLIAEEVERAEV